MAINTPVQYKTPSGAIIEYSSKTSGNNIQRLMAMLKRKGSTPDSRGRNGNQ